jgi:hypothetical protein
VLTKQQQKTVFPVLKQATCGIHSLFRVGLSAAADDGLLVEL